MSLANPKRGGVHLPRLLSVSDRGSLAREPLLKPAKGLPDACYATADGPIEITDPNNVPDVLINGPFNIINIGGMVQVTFTNVRPDDGDLFSGKTPPRLRGTVACRLLMPAGVAIISWCER